MLTYTHISNRLGRRLTGAMDPAKIWQRLHAWEQEAYKSFLETTSYTILFHSHSISPISI
jgi:hypothetical protein